MADYRIREVRNDGSMLVEWIAEKKKTAYPIPLDAQGDPLTGVDLDAWAGGKYANDIAPILVLNTKLKPLRAEIDKTRISVPTA